GQADGAGAHQVGVGLEGLDVVHNLHQQQLNAVELLVVHIVQAVGPVVPVAQAGEEADGVNHGPDHGEDQLAEDLYFGRAVQLGRLDEGTGDVVGVEVLHQDDVEGRHQIVGDDQRPNGIFDVEVVGPHDIGRDDAAAEEH